jgi:hypothetical protein
MWASRFGSHCPAVHVYMPERGHAAGDGAARCGLLHHLFAAAAGLLDAGDLDHLHLRGDHIKQFTDILAHRTRGA